MTKALTYTFKMSLADIDRALIALPKRDAKLSEDWHRVSCSVLHNWAESGAANVAAEKATEIVNAAGYRNSSIMKWFATHCGFEWDGGKFSYTRTKLDNGDEDAATVYQRAKDEPFWELDPPKTVAPFNLDTEIQKLIDRAQSRMKAAQDEKGKYSKEDQISIDRVKALKEALAQ